MLLDLEMQINHTVTGSTGMRWTQGSVRNYPEHLTLSRQVYMFIVFKEKAYGKV